jgi:hypothetical protein
MNKLCTAAEVTGANHTNYTGPLAVGGGRKCLRKDLPRPYQIQIRILISPGCFSEYHELNKGDVPA